VDNRERLNYSEQSNRIIAEVAERAAEEIRVRAEAEAKRLTDERRRMSEAFLGEQRQALAELDRATIEHFGAVKATTENLLVTLRTTIERAAEPLPFDPPPPAVEAAAPSVLAPTPPVEAPLAEPPPEPAPAPAPPPPPVAQPEPPVAPPPPPVAQPEPAVAPPEPALARPEPPVAAPEPPAEPTHEPEPDPEAIAAMPASAATPRSTRGAQLHHGTEATALAAQMATAGSSREDIVRGLRERFGIADPEAMADEAMARYGS